MNVQTGCRSGGGDSRIVGGSVLSNVARKLPFAGSVATNYQGVIQQLGDTVNITSWPQFDEVKKLEKPSGCG